MNIDPATLFVPFGGSATNAYTIILKHGSKTLKIPQADRKKHKPTATVILDALIEDAYMYDRTSTFEGWCVEFGCKPDDELAVKEYQQVSLYSEALRHFLGAPLYRQALSDWEQKNAELLFRPTEDVL